MRIAFLVAGLMLMTSAARTESLNFDDWDSILGARVKPATIDGIFLLGVDYAGLGKNRGSFDKLVARLASFDPARLKGRNEKLAFWINAYNIGALKMVLDHPGIKSLNEIGPKKGAVWKLDALKIGGKSYSLDVIEHRILRKMDEPRIHFAVVCASVSCPDLRAEAYQASRLGAQLVEQVGKFLGNSKKGLKFDAGKKSLVVTKLFEWFAKDFGSRSQMLDFIAGHVPKGRQPAGWRDFKLSYFDYSWKLNKL